MLLHHFLKRRNRLLTSAEVEQDDAGSEQDVGPVSVLRIRCKKFCECLRRLLILASAKEISSPLIQLIRAEFRDLDASQPELRKRSFNLLVTGVPGIFDQDVLVCTHGPLEIGISRQCSAEAEAGIRRIFGAGIVLKKFFK